GQTRYLNKEVRQGEMGVTNYYRRLPWKQGNDFLSLYLLISPVAKPTYVSQPKIKIEIRREFLKELKNQTSGIMLKVDWNSWNDNGEMRTLLRKSLKSFIQRIIDKEMLLTSCIDEYEEEICE
ncbi:MAG: hypothetical protein EZS28_032889, partial [Streblomastix strix]